MATLEELTIEATQEVEDAKPLYKATSSGKFELSDEEYAQRITDLAEYKYEQQQFGYIEARQIAYKSTQEQLDMQYWDSVNGTTTWADHIAQVKSDNPKPA
jgi:hypothetical protein